SISCTSSPSHTDRDRCGRFCRPRGAAESRFHPHRPCGLPEVRALSCVGTRVPCRPSTLLPGDSHYGPAAERPHGLDRTELRPSSVHPTVREPAGAAVRLRLPVADTDTGP